MRSIFLIAVVVLICSVAGFGQVPEGCTQTPEDVQLGRVVRRNWHHIDCDDNSKRVVVNSALFHLINAEIVRLNKSPKDYNVVLDADVNMAPYLPIHEGTLRIPDYVYTKKTTSKRKYAHAPQQKPAAIVTPPLTIPIPPEETAALIAIQERLKAIQADAQREWDRVLARAALRAKLTPEQFDSMVVQGDGKGGFIWSPKPVAPSKPDPLKTDTPKEN